MFAVCLQSELLLQFMFYLSDMVKIVSTSRCGREQILVAQPMHSSLRTVLMSETSLMKTFMVANLITLKVCRCCHHLLCLRVPSGHCPGLHAPASSTEQIRFSKYTGNIIGGINLIGWCSNILFHSYMRLKWRLPTSEIPATHCNWDKCLIWSGITNPAIITHALRCWTHLSQSSLKVLLE